MIIVRNEFQIKYGRIKEAVEIWKEMITSMQESDEWQRVMLMTDITGPAYTLVLEVEMRDLLEFGFTLFQRKNNEKLPILYQKFLPLCEGSKRTIYNLEA